MTLSRRLRAQHVPAVCALLALALLLGACSGRAGRAARNNPILTLSSQESLERGKELMADEKYARARDYLIHAFEIEPNSVAGREALLLAADSYYLDGGRTNFVQAEAKYRDFLNRFPTSDRAPYVQFQIANSLAQRMGRPDRDLGATRQSVEAYEDLLRLYPTSQYAAQSREKMRLVRENLAEHERMVGEFYLRYRLPKAAIARFDTLIEEYPDYSRKDEILYKIGTARMMREEYAEARLAFERLAREFPESSFTGRIPTVPAPKPEDRAEDGAGDEDGEAGALQGMPR